MTRAAVYGSPAWRRRKHDHHWTTSGAPADPLGAGNTALIASLGVTPWGFYDTRQVASVGLSGSSVATWKDVSGVGTYGPTLAPAFSGQKPTWDATNLLITFVAASSQNLENAAITGLALSTGLTVALVLASNTAATNGVFAEVGSASVSSLRLNTGSPATGYVVTSRDATSNFGTMAIASVFGSATTRRLLLGSTAGNGGQFKAEAPTASAQTGTNTGTFDAASTFNLGRTKAGASFVDMSLRAVLVFPGAYTTAQRDAIKTWATTYHGVTLL